VTVSQFNLAELIAQVRTQLEGVAHDKALSLVILCDRHISMRSDKNKIRQIINNLLSNAIKYTEEGVVKLEVREPQNRSIEIEVSDTGLGMKEEDLSKLFGNYQRIGEVKSKEIQGTGLGLALVKELITMLNGEISVQSEYGKGSVFTVYLPYSID
jgi:two-component system, autoinducer 2 sensor kinase/phosphatase LuxQ